MELNICLENLVNYLNTKSYNRWYWVRKYEIQFQERVELQVVCYEHARMSETNANKIARYIKKEIKENLGLFVEDIPKKLKVRIQDVSVWEDFVALIEIDFGDDILNIVDVKLGH